MMEFTAEMIAGFLGGQVAGDKEAKVHTVSSIEEGEPGALTYLTNPKYEKHLYKTRASIVLVNKDFTPSEPVTATLIKVEDTGAAVLKLLQMYQAAKPRKQGISERGFDLGAGDTGRRLLRGRFRRYRGGSPHRRRLPNLSPGLYR